jgi:hypothetical protein
MLQQRLWFICEQGGHTMIPEDPDFQCACRKCGPGKYRMNDEAHARLLGMLAAQNFAGVSPELREELLRFFSQPDAPYATKRNVKAWAKVQAEVEQLKAALPSEGLP